ncbi:MAG: DUF488 domain-containing protein [Nitrospirota bacterium]|nr:DUF488 domain-containing protein [Nitrospirota bacterium]MDE3034533.1 DUF488 domain-containing protein [Nitrospirota bacterium]
MIQVKRVYDPPGERDGRRFLVDRLWPRGMAKDSLKVDGWLKEVAPSHELRRWFAHDPARWKEFLRRYAEELDGKPDTWAPLLLAAGKGPVTLLFAAKNEQANNAVALKIYLESHVK